MIRIILPVEVDHFKQQTDLRREGNISGGFR